MAIDRGGSNKRLTGNTFLGVRPGTITKSSIRKKAQRDKTAAAKRAPVVNQALRDRNTLMTQAKKRYELRPVGSDVNIVRSVANWFKNEPQGNKLSDRAGAYSFSYKGGQYSGAGTQARANLLASQFNFDYNNPQSYAEMAKIKARGDLSTSQALQSIYYKHSLPVGLHDSLISEGERWIGASDNSEEITKWLAFDSIQTQEDLDAAERRWEEYQAYANRYFIKRRIYNSELGDFQALDRVRSDAPLPPWIENTPQNRKKWEYYRTYQAEVGDALHDQANKMLLEQEAYKEHPFKSAFSPEATTNLQPYLPNDEKDKPVVDSFADVVYASLGGQNFLQTYWEYARDYHLNPLLSGKFTTVIGNHIWNLMDTMDFAARGFRALVAGDRNLGGTQHSFEGQEDFWALISKNLNDDQNHYYQKLFVENGGYDLLKRARGDKSGFANSASDAEIMAQLDEAFAGAKVSWREVYDAINTQFYGESANDLLNRGFENVKEAYTNPEAEFSADTGSTLANMIVETVLDPGLLVGGMSKTGASNSAREITEKVLYGTAEEAGALLKLSNLSEGELRAAMNSKPVRKALRAFSGSNESRNILFKNINKLEADAHGLAKVLQTEGILPSDSVDSFIKNITNALAGKKNRVNAAIISSTLFDEINTNRRFGRTLAAVDKAIDTVDVAIIKGSFIEPFMLAKLYKGGRRIESRLLRTIKAKAKLEANEAAQATVNTVKDGGVVGNLQELNEVCAKNKAQMATYNEEARVVRQQYTSAIEEIEKFTEMLSDPSKSIREVQEGVSNVLSRLSGSADNSMVELDSILATARANAKSDLSDVFDSLKRTYTAFTDKLQDLDKLNTRRFLEEVSTCTQQDELEGIILKYSGSVDVHGLRTSIIDNISNKRLVTLEDAANGVLTSDRVVDDILDRFDQGLLAGRSATEERILKASGALNDADTRAVRRFSSSDQLKAIISRNPILKKALENDGKYSVVSELRAAIMKAYAAPEGVSNTRILYAVEDAQFKVGKKLRPGNKKLSADKRKEFTALKEELIDLQIALQDAINTKNVESVATYHLDRQKKFDTLINDRRFNKVFDDVYDKTLKPAIDLLSSKSMRGTEAFKNTPLYMSLMRMRDMKYAYRRYRRFISDLDMLGLSEEAKYAVRNGLFGCYGESNKKLIDITRKPGEVRKYLETMMYNEFSSSKVGMTSLTAKLKSIDSATPDPMIADYIEQIKSNPTLEKWYRDIAFGDPADPSVYLQKQVLSTILLDPSAISRFNEYDRAPVFVHVSTTGLSDDAAITGISYYKWNKINIPEGENLTIQQIYDALNGNVNVRKRVMSEAEIASMKDDVFYSIYHDSVGDRACEVSKLREKYAKSFATAEDVSEASLLEGFFTDIYPDTIEQHRKMFHSVPETVVPTFVVHDLEGFNIPFINRRATAVSDVQNSPRTVDYVNRLSKRVENCSKNTFNDLRKVVNDNMLSSDEFDMLEKYINSFAEDLAANTGADFSMLDISNYTDEMQTVYDSMSRIRDISSQDDVIKVLSNSYDSKSFFSDMYDAREAIKEVEVLNDQAKQIASVSRLDRTRPVSEVRAAAEASGERILNMSDKYHLRSIRQYFYLGDIDDGVMETFANLKKMSDISKWIEDKAQYAMRSGAEKILAPNKAKYDALIKAVSNLANQAPHLDGSLSYLAALQIPQTATESYLLCQKLYDDLLKFWLNSELVEDVARYNKTGKVSKELRGGLRAYVLAQFVEGLDFSSVVKGQDFSDILRMLEGEGQSLIRKDVPIYSASAGIYGAAGEIKEELELADNLRKGYLEMRSIAADQEYLDSTLRSAGIVTKHDFSLGLMFTHTSDLFHAFGILEDTGRDRLFDDCIKRVSELYVARVHNVRLNRLKTNGEFDIKKIVPELIWNNTNHVVFQKAYFKEEELRALRSYIESLDDFPYVKVAEDHGALCVYLTNKCKVYRTTWDGKDVRFIQDLVNNSYGARYTAPAKEHIPLPGIDELEPILLEEGLDIRSVSAAYTTLHECWDDVALLSGGASNGTLGRVVGHDDMEEYYKVANTLMPDLLSSEGLRNSQMYGGTFYDPGFIRQGDFNIFSEYLHTMRTQHENFKVSGAFINQVFGTGNVTSFGELTRFFSNEDIFRRFNDDSDFVVCALVPADDTKLGLKVRKLNFYSVSDVDTAKQLTNTAVLPYDMYLEMVDAINVKEYPSELNRAVNKLMLIYKASSLFHPGTWIRNFIDATQKSATDLGESPLNIFSTLAYEMKAYRDVSRYAQAMKYGDDFLNEANWPMLQRMLHTDMSYENFELLRGVMESNQYTSKSDKFLRKARQRNGGRELISGENIGLRNLSEKDISKAYKQASKHSTISMEQKRFKDIYLGVESAVNAEEKEQFNEAMRQISNYLHSHNAIFDLNNMISTSFKPFNLGEVVVRYAQLCQLNDLGFSNNQAIRRVHLTQFRAADHYNITNQFEYILPFITFKYNNLKYWMRMMEENPAYFKYFQKLYGNIYEDTIESYVANEQELDYETNYMLQSGGIPIGNGKYYFKLNPSFLDAISSMYGLTNDLVSNQNPLLRMATRASMFELGLDSKYIFQELDLEPKDGNVDLETIADAYFPRIAKLKQIRKIDADGFRTWANGLGPNAQTLHKLIPSLIGKNYEDYSGSDFETYQQNLMKHGLWFDCNIGKVVSGEPNEQGMNDPNITWMDRQNYMMLHFNMTWDANKGKFVNFWEKTEGGLNQYFDFENDPEAWDRLCAEYARKGMKFDYNTKHFKPAYLVRNDGLNNPNLDFSERVKLMEEKFPNMKWDANQNCFVDLEKGEPYISGGLNDVDNFRDVMFYRYILFGEEYNKDTHHFEASREASVVTVQDLFRLKQYDNYFAMLGIPRLTNVKEKLHFTKDGYLMAESGKYVLLSDAGYNQRLFHKLRSEYDSTYRRGYRGWKRYSHWRHYNWSKEPYKGRTLPQHFYTGYGWNDEEGYYRFNYSYNYQYHNPQPARKLHRLLAPRIQYPYGGGYNKYSFYTR